MSTKTITTPKATRKQTELIEARLELSRQIEELNDQIGDVEARLIASIGIGNSIEVEGLAQVTVVTQTGYDIDFEALTIAHPTWARKVTKKVFDRPKFGLLRKAGEVPADVLGMVVEKVSSPFLKVTLRQPKS